MASDLTTQTNTNEITTSGNLATGSCDEGTCQNGGTCVNVSVDGVQGYRCECTVSFYGDNCQFGKSSFDFSV